MKQTILSFLLALLPIMASADAVEIDGVYYNLITKAKQAEVTYGPNRYAGEIVIPNVILYNNIEYDVTTIRSFTFSNCFDLTSVTIPNTLKSIEGMCFNGCEGLTSVYIMDIESWLNMKFQDNPLTYASHLYVNGEEIENLIIPNNLTTINDRVFSGWKGLVSLTIPSSVTSIGEASFAGCSGLTSVIIPNSVITIGRNAFSRCSALTSITIPNSVISIGGNEQYSDGGAFSNCSSLMSVTFSNNLNKIYAETFKDCTSLISIVIPNSVTYIGNSAFYNCSSLNSITIGNSVNTIKYGAFAKCSDLTDVYCLAENVPNTNADAFKDSYIEHTTLHVPAASLNNYNDAEPWKNFKEIVALESGDIPEMQKCATPTIAFENGKITFSCETEGAEFISTITPAEINKKYDSEIVISNTYKVTVYATKVGYIDSDKATIEIQANSGVFGDVDGNGVVNVADHVKLSSIIMEQSE